MASFRHIFLVFALCLLNLCQIWGADTREEWIAALSKLPWLEERYNLVVQNHLANELDDDDDGDGDGMRGMTSTFFSYEPSSEGDISSYQPSEGDQVGAENGTAELRMPYVHPERANQYFCHSEPMPNQGVYLVGFHPLTTPGTAHHMLIYGCEQPGSTQEAWDCGEMDLVADSDVVAANPCASGSKILYAWAMDAPALDLPKGVGFEVGADTGIDYLVIQVHYNNVDKFQDGSTDDSGVALSWTLTPQPLKAGVYFMGTDGEIPGKSEDVHLEAECEYNGPTIYPFAYRTHTHKLGELVSGYRVRDNEWTEIGKRSPQLPQMFNPIYKDIPVEDGDHLAMRCTFASDRDETTYIGPTGEDEMCNFYIMFYIPNGAQMPRNQDCWVPAGFKWQGHLENIPDKEASTMDTGAAANSM